MGNDQSHMKSLNFSDKPAEKINDCYLYDGEYNGNKITIFEPQNSSYVPYFSGSGLDRSIKVNKSEISGSLEHWIE